MDNNIFSLTAHIDLLGFSNHFILSNSDLRTKIGSHAIERLTILDNAVCLIEDERASILSADHYPETFRIMRFNDSIILGMDIDEPIIPMIGRPNEEVKFSLAELNKFFSKRNKSKMSQQAMISHFDKEAIKTAQFIGIASRLHNYINDCEYKIHMPGCRTILSSGLRYRFFNYKKNEDFYSANFSLSNAYLVNDMGSKYGFTGNKCYLENNAARICCYNEQTKRLLGYTKYFPTEQINDPFIGKDSFFEDQLMYQKSDTIEVDLFHKRYSFRAINTSVASNLQLFPNIGMLEENEHKSKIYNNTISMLKTDTPDIIEINNTENEQYESWLFKYPLMRYDCSLDKNIHTSLKTIKADEI